MRILLDTCAVIWFFQGSSKLSRKARSHIENVENEVYFSPASAWEIATKYRKNNLKGVEELVNSFEAWAFEQNILELPINSKHGITGGLLQIDHKDPFDRLIAAQAMLETMALITIDPVFNRLPIQIIWD